MISPDKFRNNEHTLLDNVFQSKKTNQNQIEHLAIKEFNRLRELISNSGMKYSVLMMIVNLILLMLYFQIIGSLFTTIIKPYYTQCLLPTGGLRESLKY